MLVALATFTFAAVLIVLLPGPDTLVVVRGLVRGGRAGGIRTTLGVLSGLTVWVCAASLGLSALLRASEVGYEALKIAGAVYLCWLGVSSLRGVWRRGATDTAGAESLAAAPVRSGLLGSGYAAGLLTDVLNPKVGVFFISFLPGFVPDGHSIGWTSLLFGAIFVLLTAAYFAVLVGLSGKVTGWMQAPRVRRRLDALTGAVLVGFGIRLATEG